MNGYDWAVILFLVLALILPISAMRHRSVPIPRLLRLAGLWIIIFLAVALAFTLFDE